MTTRSRQEDVDRAYKLQSKAAIAGAASSTAVGIGLAIIGHYTLPLFRRQTLAFKGFLVSGFTIFGLVFGAETALLAYEVERRTEENIIRKEARLALAQRGLIGTETEIAKWRTARDNTITPQQSHHETQVSDQRK